MKLPELKTIKSMRKHAGINQTELAKASGVSQSLIARIETGKVDPAYSRVKDIFSALESLGTEKALVAEKIMNRKVISVKSNTSVREAASVMKKRGISQMPVIDYDVVVGSVSESGIIERIASNSIENVSLVPVKDVMEDAFPQVDSSTPLGVISMLLEYNAAVLVSEKGKIKGIITKADVLKLM